MSPGIKVMADYHCWPLWHHGGSEVGNIDPRTLGLSSELQTRLKRWSEEYDSHLDLSDPASVSWTEEEDIAFDAEGQRLCTALAVELGPRFAVSFFDRHMARCVPVLELYVPPQAPNQSPQTTRAFGPRV